MPRGKRTRANTRATTTARRTTRAAARNDTTATLGQVVPITTVQPPLPPAPLPAQTDFTAFLHLIRNEVRAELDAQRVAVGALPVATQSQDPQEPPLHPQQHPSQQISPTGMSQQQQPSLQQRSQAALHAHCTDPAASTTLPCTRDTDNPPHNPPRFVSLVLNTYC